MSQLMGCYLKIQAVNHFPVVSGLFSQNRSNRMPDSFSIFIPVITPLLNCPGNDVLPKSLELCVGQWFAILIWNNILRSRISFAAFRQSAKQTGRGIFLSAAFVFNSSRMTGRLCSVCHARRTVRYGVSVSRYTESHCRARISSLLNPAYRPSITNTYGGSP